MKQGDIVLVPFPFSNLASAKLRPAVILSNSKMKGLDILVAGITSQKKGDYSVELCDSDLEEGVLPLTSYVKVGKIATLEKGMVRKKVARIGKKKMQEILGGHGKLIALEKA